MENLIRILTIFSQSQPLAFMFFCLMVGIVLIYIARRLFHQRYNETKIEMLELKKTLGELQYRLNHQIEARPPPPSD